MRFSIPGIFRKVLLLSFVLVLNLPALSQIIVDPSAPIQFQPTLQNINPNSTLINIVNPNANGLSHNIYTEFNAGAGENILFNNGLASSFSQLLNLSIAANPNLNQSAQIILNEITGSNPSLLNGNFEVLGSSASLIFANPNGLTINGGNFINSSTLTFVAGVPSFAGSQLSYLTNPNGIINIGGLNSGNAQNLSFYGHTINNNASLSSPNGTSQTIGFVDANSINPGIAAGRLYVPVDGQGNVIAINNSNLSMGSHNANNWDIADGRIQFKAHQLNNTGNINAKQLYVEANNFDNTANIQSIQNIISVSNEFDNSAQIHSSQDSMYQGGSLRNSGSISSDTNLNLDFQGNRSESRIQRHIGDNPNATEIIDYSLWNLGDINAENVYISADKLRNTYWGHINGDDIFITAQNLINEGTGSKTEHDGAYRWFVGYREERGFYEQQADHYFWYWIGRAGAGTAAQITANNNIDLDVHDTFSESAVIQAKNDIFVKGHNFTNKGVNLTGTQLDGWWGAGATCSSCKWKTFWRQKAIGTIAGNLEAGDDVSFNLTGNFNNSTNLIAGGDFYVQAANFTNGLTDPSILAGPRDYLPSVLYLNSILPINGEGQITGTIDPGLETKLAQIFYQNQFLAPDWDSSQDMLQRLLDNQRELLNQNTDLTLNRELPESIIDSLTEPLLWYENDEWKVYIPDGYHGPQDPTGLLSAENIEIDIDGQAYNSGTLKAENEINIQADELLNEKRLARNYKTVKNRSGKLSGSSYEKQYYDEIQDGGYVIADEININTTGNTINRGGLLHGNSEVNIEAENIINEVQEGQDVVTFDAGNLAWAMGLDNWFFKPILEAATISSGGDINLIAQDTVSNLGSEIIAQNNINITGTEYVESDWVAREYEGAKTANFKGLEISGGTEYGHVTSSSTIESIDGDVNINTTGDFLNNASNILANGDISIDADGNVIISDDFIQSINEQWGFSIDIDPAYLTAGASYTESSQTTTTHQSSNVIANNININSGNDITAQGSNLLAEGDVNLNASNDVNITSGSYTDTFEVDSAGVSVSPNPTGVSVSVSVTEGDGSTETITQTNVIASNVNINAGDTTSVHSSNVQGNESVNINTDNFSATGEYETSESEFNTVGASVTVDWNGVPTGGSVNYVNSQQGSGEYIASNINSSNTNINANNSNLDGAIVDGQGTGVLDDYSYDQTIGGGIGWSTNGGPSIFVTNGDGTLSLSQQGIGGSYNITDDISLGGMAGPDGVNVNGSLWGARGGINRSINNPGISNDHPIWDVYGTYAILSGGASFQHGEIKRVSFTSPFWRKALQINDWDYVCFPAGTPITMASGEKKDIEEVKQGDSVRSWNESIQQFENNKVTQLFRKKADELVYIKLANGKEIKSTKEHPYLTNRGWIEGERLSRGDKIKSLNGWITVSNTSLVKLESEITVYNFEVAESHTYVAGETGLVVHNQCHPAETLLHYMGSSGKPKDFDIDKVDTSFVFSEVFNDGGSPETQQTISFLNDNYGKEGKTFTLNPFTKNVNFGFLNKQTGKFFNEANVLGNVGYHVDNFRITTTKEGWYMDADVSFIKNTVNFETQQSIYPGFTDYYNFNKRSLGQRTQSAERMTRIGNLIPGEPFYIRINGTKHIKNFAKWEDIKK